MIKKKLKICYILGSKMQNSNYDNSYFVFIHSDTITKIP